MGKIKILLRDGLREVRGSESIPDEEKPNYSEGELAGLRTRYFPIQQETLELFEVSLGPDVEVQAHAHTVAEIIYVIEGELQIGSRVCPPGTAIFIDEKTLYSFRTGPAGGKFVNFRGQPDSKYIRKQDFLAQRKPAPVSRRAATGPLDHSQ
jgi:hypothetical protein